MITEILFISNYIALGTCYNSRIIKHLLNIKIEFEVIKSRIFPNHRPMMNYEVNLYKKKGVIN